MQFAVDKYCAEFDGIRLFVEEYSFSRGAAIGETVLLNGECALRNGGRKAARIILSGKSEFPCTHLLDRLTASGDAVVLNCGGMVFADAVLVSYSCKGKSGSSEAVTAEFVCTAQVAETAVTA